MLLNMMYLPAWLAIPDRAWIPDRPPMVVGRHCSTFPIDCGMGGGKLFVTWALGKHGNHLESVAGDISQQYREDNRDIVGG